jgi:prephenate dehydrogenase
MGEKIKVGIIGGTGKMGKWFKPIFENEGCEVLISSRSTDIKPIDCAKQCDVVVISVPIKSTVKVIKELAPYVKKTGLLMDITSLKVKPMDAMMTYAKSEVIGTHPVFGPSVKDLKDQTVVVTPGRGKKWLKWLTDILEKNSAKIKITTPQKHDRVMAIIQGIIHFSNISIGHAIKKLGMDINETLEFASPIYKLRMDMVGRVLNQDPELYADIEISNPETAEALEAYVKSAEELQRIVISQDKEKFIEFFKEASDFLGDFKKEATEYSDYLIEQLIKRKK